MKSHKLIVARFLLDVIVGPPVSSALFWLDRGLPLLLHCRPHRAFSLHDRRCSKVHGRLGTLAALMGHLDVLAHCKFNIGCIDMQNRINRINCTFVALFLRLEYVFALGSAARVDESEHNNNLVFSLKLFDENLSTMFPT